MVSPVISAAQHLIAPITKLFTPPTPEVQAAPQINIPPPTPPAAAPSSPGGRQARGSIQQSFMSGAAAAQLPGQAAASMSTPGQGGKTLLGS